MEGFLRVDTSLVMSVVGVMFWDKLVRGIEGERLLPVSKWETLVAKSGQDGRNDTNRAQPRGLDLGPTTEAKLIVFMLWNSGGMQDVCWFVSTFSLEHFFFYRLLNPSPVTVSKRYSKTNRFIIFRHRGQKFIVSRHLELEDVLS